MSGGSPIQWYPGHMAKTRRQMEQDLKQVDAVCELLDARIPLSSRNPDIAALCGNKPRLVLLNRADLADPAQTERWQEWFKREGLTAVPTDCKSRKGVSGFQPAARALLAEKLKRYREKGQTGRALRFMIAGIPNVGKSTFINQISGRKGAKAENRPGVTRGRQWIAAGPDLLLLDTPGILWPKFEDPEVGRRLACTGAVKDDVLDTLDLAAGLAELLWNHYPERLRERYGMDEPPGTPGWRLLEVLGRRRGFLVPGGGADSERAARTLLDEYRSGKLGRLTLETPEEERGEC